MKIIILSLLFLCFFSIARANSIKEECHNYNFNGHTYNYSDSDIKECLARYRDFKKICTSCASDYTYFHNDGTNKQYNFYSTKHYFNHKLLNVNSHKEITVWEKSVTEQPEGRISTSFSKFVVLCEFHKYKIVSYWVKDNTANTFTDSLILFTFDKNKNDNPYDTFNNGSTNDGDILFTKLCSNI